MQAGAFKQHGGLPEKLFIWPQAVYGGREGAMKAGRLERAFVSHYSEDGDAPTRHETAGLRMGVFFCLHIQHDTRLAPVQLIQAVNDIRRQQQHECTAQQRHSLGVLRVSSQFSTAVALRWLKHACYWCRLSYAYFNMLIECDTRASSATQHMHLPLAI